MAERSGFETSVPENAVPENAVVKPAGPELFVVEGRSAANAVRKVIDKATQSVYAVQGKPMNVVKASQREIDANERVAELYRRIVRNRAEGFDPDPSPDAVPFDRVILLADADVDGVHAKALLLVMIDAILPDLVASEMLFTVRAPLFAVTCDQRSSPVFAYSPDGRQRVTAQLLEQGASGVESVHFKGIASMNSDEIWESCLNPATRLMTPLTAEHVGAARSALA
ncbi:MAG: toprim domain-containing protein [Acidimicrobiales bacterium]